MNHPIFRRLLPIVAAALPQLAFAGPPFERFVDPHPGAGNRFGDSVVVLSTGNVVITSPFDDSNGTDTGAVYLFNGATGALISELRGSTPGDAVGSTGVTALTNGNFVVSSRNWRNGAVQNAGAVTLGNGTTGISGVVSAANSLVGSQAMDFIGDAVHALSNGNYLVYSGFWDNGEAVNAGAVTWGSGTSGVTGPVSAANSLVGSTTDDRIGQNGIWFLANGNYVVSSQSWDNGGATDAGAVTWGSGASGVSGVVGPANSLVGSTANDRIGQVTPLANGNYVVGSRSWDNGGATDAGAATWGSGTTGISGTISAANSLVGSLSNDEVGVGMTALANGNYLVRSRYWNSHRGAVTWGSGTAGVKGNVSASNSLVGSLNADQIGSEDPIQLGNGHYVVISFTWNVQRGSATWCNGTTGRTGTVSASNSLVGSSSLDRVSSGGVTVLTNGNYVVISPNWRNGTISMAGAVTWGNGATGTTGTVSAANSLVGSTASDQVGSNGVARLLINGNYVVRSSLWDNGGMINAGAATWGSGTGGTVGAVSPSNSLVGGSPLEQVSATNVVPLVNGNYVVLSNGWNGSRGAATWGNGTTGVSGTISSANSLVGSTTNDVVGGGGVTPLNNGHYLVRSQSWNNGAATGAGAVTWGNGTTGISGEVSSLNSLVGSATSDGIGLDGVFTLQNGNYLVASSAWGNGAVANAGAVTWGDGATGTSGPVSASNSLVGSTANDNIGGLAITTLTNGNYLVRSHNWDNGILSNAGAVTWGNGTTGTTGIITTDNSMVGLAANTMLQQYPLVRDNVNGTFYGRFRDEEGGVVRVGSQADGFAPVVVSPEIAIEQPSGTDLTDGVSSIGFGTVNVGANTSRVFTVRNTGTAGLDSIVANFDGGDAGDFTLTQAPATNLAPGASTTFEVRFTPAAAGNRGTTLRVTSNDANENPFDISLIGVGEWPLAIAQRAYLKASNAGTGDNFGGAVNEGGIGAYPLTGVSVAVSDDTVVVGAPMKDINAATNSGAAYVFVKAADGTWSQQAYLKAVTPVANEWFGWSVAISGDTIAVGAPFGGGAVYVFQRTGSSWTQQAEIRRSMFKFGYSVAIDGNTLLVGSPEETQAFNTRGAVLVYNRAGSAWTLGQTLTAPSPGDYDQFGFAVAISGEAAAIGAPGEDSSSRAINQNPTNNGAEDAGAAYVFRRSSGVWTHEAYLKASNADPLDLMGWSVAISGDTVLVGAPFEDSLSSGIGGSDANGGDSVGAAYVFVRTGGVWSQQAYIKAANPGNDHYFGLSVALSGNGALVGAFMEDGGSSGVDGSYLPQSKEDSGAAYLFSRTGSSWGQLAYLKASNPDPSDYFGFGVALSGGTAVVSAINEDGIATNSGAAYLFHVGPLSGDGASPSLAAAIAAAGLTGPDAEPNATPFGDGVENLLKYAFNMNLAGPDSSTMTSGGNAGLPFISRTGEGSSGILRFEFVERIGSGLSYTPKKSTSLDAGDWLPLSDLPTIIPIDANWRRVIYEEPADPSVMPACFGRIEVTIPSP